MIRALSSGMWMPISPGRWPGSPTMWAWMPRLRAAPSRTGFRAAASGTYRIALRDVARVEHPHGVAVGALLDLDERNASINQPSRQEAALSEAAVSVAFSDRRIFLFQVEGIERFLHRSYLGKKRFSIEGLDMLVPMLDELLERADVVSLHCPLNPRTRGLIGARELGLMKRDALNSENGLSAQPTVVLPGRTMPPASTTRTACTYTLSVA